MIPASGTWPATAPFGVVPTEEITMADDRNRTGEVERALIDLTDNHEIRDWSLKLGVTELELQAAVEKVGPKAEDVRHFLGKQASGTTPFPGQGVGLGTLIP